MIQKTLIPPLRKLFGTDGIRGHANHHPMTVETALALGRAAGKLLVSKYGSDVRVVIGKDTRLSCYMFENALIAGLCSMGVHTLMVGPLPTPGVAFITRAYRAQAGIVISASHNAYYDNGIKFFSSEGFKLSDELELEIEALICQNHYENYLPEDHAIGKNAKIIDADGRYIEFVKATFPRHLSLKNLNIVLDCANGAAFRVAPLIFKELDARLHVYSNVPDGMNINHQCGALHPEVAQKAVIEHHAHIGIALDGDGDRLILIDENAQVVNGDTILAICAHHMQRQGKLKNNRIVATVMSNFGFIKSMENLGIEVIRSQVGDRYVIQEMLSHDCNLGGEQSGHLIFLDHNSTGDGLVAALQVLSIMLETDSTLSELASIVKRYPQALVNTRIDNKVDLMTHPTISQEIQRIIELLGDSGRAVVRFSGTEPLCRVMIESLDQKQAWSLAQHLADFIAHELTSEKN
jgi:phosphoglucosamine mutase